MSFKSTGAVPAMVPPVVRAMVINTFHRNPLAVTAVFASRSDLVTVTPRHLDCDCEAVEVSLSANFADEKDYLVAVTRAGENGEYCRYTLLAGRAPAWYAQPQNEHFNPLAGSDCMDSESRILVALPVAFLAERLAHEKPKV